MIRLQWKVRSLTAPTTPRLVHDIWLGDSRELCKKFEAKKKVACVITDPPFGVDNLSNSAVTVEGKANATKILNDETPEQAISIFQDVMDVLLPCTLPDSDLYIFTAHQVLREWLDVADSLSRHGFKRSAILVWEKDGPGMGDTRARSWGQGMEFILFLKKGRREATDQRRNGILYVPQERPHLLFHPHQKPTALIELFIKHSTNPGDLIVDPFGGSGSTVRAARNLNRHGIGIELDPDRHAKAKRKLDEESEVLF
jgi:adenine-specific DNA-methyltransferase